MGVAASVHSLAAVPDSGSSAVVADAAARAPANTQSSNDTGAGVLKEVVVTAQGRSQSLQSVPVAVSVVSGAALEKEGIRNLNDLSSRVADVEVSDSSSSDILTMRGVGSGVNPGFEQSVGVFVDGMYLARSRAMRASLFDVDRVEVLKGPQTTFFGDNAIAGAFSITTRWPEHEFEYNGSALYGMYGKYSVEGGLTTPITDSLSMRIAGTAYGQSGYVYNDFTGSKGPKQSDGAARISFLWQPLEDFTSRFRVDQVRLRDNDDFPSELLNCPPTPVAAAGLCAQYLKQSGGQVHDTLNLTTATYPSKYQYDMTQAEMINELSFDGFKLSATTGYFHHEVTDYLSPVPIPVAVVGSDEAVSGLTFLEHYHDLSQELRLISPEGQRVTYLAGLYYESGEFATDNFDAFDFAKFGAFAAPLYTASDLIASEFGMREADQNASAFAAVTVHITHDFRLNGGLRYSSVHEWAHRFLSTGMSTTNAYATPGNYIPGSAAQQAVLDKILSGSPADYPETARTDKKLMPTVSLQYDVTPSVMTYASFTQGFKAGGFADGFVANPTFAPEDVNAYEAGVKSRGVFGIPMMLNIDAFWENYTNLQEAATFTLPNGQRSTLVVNAASVRSRGVEASAALDVNSVVQVHADVAYLNARYVSFPNGPCTDLQALVAPNCVQNLAGKETPYAPNWSGDIGMSVVEPVGSGELSFEPSVRFSSWYEEQANDSPLYIQSGFAKLDARVAYHPQGGRWNIALIATNLSNKITASFMNNAQTSPGTFYALPEEGRAVSLQVAVHN
jgi:iron complex outermembrane recepter protein